MAGKPTKSAGGGLFASSCAALAAARKPLTL
jgi:hypothetical protein